MGKESISFGNFVTISSGVSVILCGFRNFPPVFKARDNQHVIQVSSGG